MPSTYAALHYHIIFATRERIPLIESEWMSELHAYLAGTLRGLGAKTHIIGGIAEHVHLFVELRTTTVIPDLLRELKKASTFWVQERKPSLRFGWQGGYAIFSVSPFEHTDLIAYIANQEEHHKRESAYDELRRLLDNAGVEFDPKYFE